MDLNVEQTDAFGVTIFIAGDYNKALATCRAYCDSVGLCVTVEPTTYVYSGGMENGVRIGLINYARFPSGRWSLLHDAQELGTKLLDVLEQDSFTIYEHIEAADARSYRLSRKKDD